MSNEWPVRVKAVDFHRVNPPIDFPTHRVYQLSIPRDMVATYPDGSRRKINEAQSDGGIADLKDGIAPVLGFAGGVFLGKGLTLTGGPELILGKSSSHIILGSLGLLIEF